MESFPEGTGVSMHESVHVNKLFLDRGVGSQLFEF